MNMTKEEFFKKYVEVNKKKAPSDIFASGAVFDLSRLVRMKFEEAFRENSLNSIHSLYLLFVNSYFLFLEHPEVVKLPPYVIIRENEDTFPGDWEANHFQLDHGDHAALLFMPIQNETYEARIVGIIFSDKGDGYYYCRLYKDQARLSDVIRNMGLQGIHKVGEVNGRGFDLMHSFLDCIKRNYYCE